MKVEGLGHIWICLVMNVLINYGCITMNKNHFVGLIALRFNMQISKGASTPINRNLKSEKD